MKKLAFLLTLSLAVLLGGTESRLGELSAPTGGTGFLGNLIPALMLILFTHIGWDRVGYVAGEMKNPREIIPRSMIYGLGLIILIRTFLGFTLHFEVEGKWPWDRAKQTAKE